MSHERTGLAAAALLWFGVTNAPAEPSVIGTNLNLRSGPGAAFAVITTMPAGARLDVKKCRAKWCQVSFGSKAGYARRDLLGLGSSSYASAGPPQAAPPPEPKAPSGGPLIWQWRNAEWRDRHWRRLEWHNRMKRR